ncbi:helix-turn-helix domain-containing protein [Plantibacter sp. YIM 135347]|uniref:helix-turn-helix domain-containing protein n=1 Tax=Plantibacter sp. YIM 135347 TaxID=3423919 RepID=UPI003D34491B
MTPSTHDHRPSRPAGATTEEVLSAVGPRLRSLRLISDRTLAELSAQTDISVSTLSRLESGQRKATLELLLPLARAYGVPLDELVGAPATGDPRIHIRPVKRYGMTILPLSRGGEEGTGVQAFKHVIPASSPLLEPTPQVHEGYEWIYVLGGKLRLVLGEHDLILPAGEAAEFDTHTPHWFGRTADGAVEFLSLFGRQGERMHVRARPGKRP